MTLRDTVGLSDSNSALITKLVRSFKNHRWAHTAPKASFAYQRDRDIAVLFEGATRINALEALNRSQGIYSARRPIRVGELLRWACKTGLVKFTESDGCEYWELMRYGVTFIPRGQAALGWPDSVDVRLDEATGGLPLRTLCSREFKLRERKRRSDLSWMIQSTQDQLDCRAADLTLPLAMQGPDLPIVETVGQLRACFLEFGRDLSIWRAAEIYRAAWELPRPSQQVAQYRVDHNSAPELDDFNIS